MQNQNTLSDGTATESTCSGLLIARMLPTVQAMKAVKYLCHQYWPLFPLNNWVEINS